MVPGNYYRVIRLALDVLDKDGVRTASRKIDKKNYPEWRNQI
ncbi:MAG: hypothetical protein SRB2_00787 [Desulfobacteraceae bacterium Eth-SRB2]|nr:MAG: hypothetical protein SRB2_00787 [Desulfobacteraceae bacterium Eth-SRB2]